jgi:7-dehydrocholesterol reductase
MQPRRGSRPVTAFAGHRPPRLDATRLQGLFLSANGQRHRARRLGSRCRIFGCPPRLIDAEYVTADDARHTSVLLASGWWGIVRHPNYVGDLMIATATGLTCGVRHLLPWSYTIFLAGLLVRRLRHNERRCQAKYESAWDAYRALVPYRLIPGIW